MGLLSCPVDEWWRRVRVAFCLLWGQPLCHSAFEKHVVAWRLAAFPTGGYYLKGHERGDGGESCALVGWYGRKKSKMNVQGRSRLIGKKMAWRALFKVALR